MHPLIMVAAASTGGSVGVDVSAITSHSTSDGTPPVFCNVKLDNDGDYYKSTSSGSFGASSGTYITTGSSSDVYVERTIDVGALDTDGIGASRVVCSTDRVLGVEDPGQTSATVTLNFYASASGGSPIGTKQITLTATDTS